MDRFFERHTLEQVVGAGSGELLKRFLDEDLGEGELFEKISKWEDFDDCRRSQGESACAFVGRYERAY